MRAGDLLQQMQQRSAGLKTLIYSDPSAKASITPAVYALVCETLKCETVEMEMEMGMDPGFADGKLRRWRWNQVLT